MNQKHFSLLLFLILFFQNIISAQSEFLSKVSTATVYDRGAKITRSAAVSIEQGTSVLVFSNLYHKIRSATLQVEIEDKNVSILETNFKQNYLKAPNDSKEIKNLKDSLKIINKALSWNRHQKSILEGEESIIKSNKKPVNENATFSVANLKELTAFYRERLMEIRLRLLELEDEWQADKEVQNRLNKTIKSLQSGGKYVGEVTVKVFAKNMVTTKLKMSYLVNEAGWKPVYDLKSTGVDSPMEMTYRGAIFQKTGYDWEGVELSLSSARPTQNNTQPTLKRILVSIEPTYQIDTVIAFSPETYEEQIQLVKNEGLNWSDVSTTTTSFQYNLEDLHTIPADGKEYFVTIQNIDLPANYEYFSIPKKESAAFLVAKITDYGQYNFLTGNANLFFENTFIGTTRINRQSTEDTLQVSLGKDLGIVVEREQQQFTAPKFIGNSIKETFQFDLIVRNNKAKKITIEVKDQIPISSHKELEIKLLEKSRAKFDETSGILTWQFDLAPNETKKLPFSYSLKYPKGKRIWMQN